MFGASSELASVMEFGLYAAKFHFDWYRAARPARLAVLLVSVTVEPSRPVTIHQCQLNMDIPTCSTSDVGTGKRRGSKATHHAHILRDLVELC